MNTPSLGVACHFRDEVNALPGFLEMASHFFSEIFLADCSVDMTPSTDGSLDLIRKFGLPDPPLWSLANGFGAVRSQLVHSSKTDWVIVMDADERIFVSQELLKCEGTDRYPAQEKPDLRVSVIQSCYNQRELLMNKIQEAERRGIRCVRMQRRHWFDFTNRHPCENWNMIKDYQMRCMKSRADVGFRTIPKIHEAAVDARTGQSPEYIEDDHVYGPYLDHYHCAVKPREPEQRAEDIRTYDALHHSDTHTPIPTR